MNTRWSWSPQELGALIGIVTSGAKASLAPIRVSRELISEVRDEMLVIIDDYIEDRRFLGSIKGSTKLDIAVDGSALPTTFSPEHSRHYSAPMMRTYVEIFGEINRSGGIELSFAIPRPGSHVYVVVNGERLAEVLRLPQGLNVGIHKFSGMSIHLEPCAVYYHVAVLGATGTGKSRLVKALIEELLSKTRYKVLIFDHTGVDYADPQRWRAVGIEPEIIDASRIVLDPLIVSEILRDRMGLTGYHEDNVFYIIVRYVYDEVIKKRPEVIEKFRGHSGGRVYSSFIADIDFELLVNEYFELCKQREFSWDYDIFAQSLPKYLSEINARDATITKYRLSLSIRVGRTFFERYLGAREIVIGDIVDKLLRGDTRLVIVDLSTELEYDVKRYIVYQFLHSIWDRIQIERQQANLIAVIDEAHNYACTYCKPSVNEIARTAREGRKWGFGIVLASQRIIDIAPEVRGNINTVFFSRLQTHSDYQELRNWIEGVQHMEYTLPMLSRREFFVTGLANPFRKPLLLKVRNVD